MMEKENKTRWVPMSQRFNCKHHTGVSSTEIISIQITSEINQTINNVKLINSIIDFEAKSAHSWGIEHLPLSWALNH